MIVNSKFFGINVVKKNVMVDDVAENHLLTVISYFMRHSVLSLSSCSIFSSFPLIIISSFSRIYFYRVNPSNAYVWDYANVEFINRGVAFSRAAGDNSDLLDVITTKVVEGEDTYVKYFNKSGNGEITVSAAVNDAQNVVGRNKHNIAALKLKNGQSNWTVSDYVSIEPIRIDAILVDSAKMTANRDEVKTFYNRTKALTSKSDETDKFVKEFCPLGDPANVQMKYDKSLDLSTLPGLFSAQEEKYLKELGFTGTYYRFSKPETYKSNDAQGTNQQWFVQLDGTVLSANAKNLTSGLTPAIGRTPVVRVDAFILDNAGVERMLGSAYIKVEITRNDPVTPGDKDKDPYTHNLVEKDYEYHELGATATEINQMKWEDVNNLIYGQTGLTSNTFWDYYGGENKEYEVTVTTTEKNGNVKAINTGKAKADQPYTITQEGITCETTLGSGDTQTSNISFGVDNKVKTENTYKDIDGKGAEYVVTITIPSNDKKVRGNVVLVQKFYVREDCKGYEYNPNYYAGTVDNKPNVVVAKGKIVDDKWKLEMNISEVFKMINGKNVFEYYNTAVKNVTAIKFSLDPEKQDGVKYEDVATPDVNGLISLDKPLEEAYKFASMKYVLTLVNGETCEFAFNVQFLNPFRGTRGGSVELNGTVSGTVTAPTAQEVRVNDVDGKAIYEWDEDAKALGLTELATDTYKVGKPTVKYDFDKSAKDYKNFTDNLDPKATFEIDETTGEITYVNLGAQLQPSYTFDVIVTITFDQLSVVKCAIPFTIKGSK